jgi:hypothetical protein
MAETAFEYIFDLELVEETFASLDGNTDALSLLAESVGRPELSRAFRYAIQMLEEHHAALRWHLMLPLRRTSTDLQLIEGGANV